MSELSKIETREWQQLESIVAQGASDPRNTPMPLWCIALQANISVPLIRKWMQAHGVPYEGCMRCVYRPGEGCTQKLCDQSWHGTMERDRKG